MKYVIGLILFLLGVVLLAGNLGLLAGVNAGDFVVFWPALLVVVGVYLMTRKSRFAAFINVLVVLILFVGILAAVALVPRSERLQRIMSSHQIERQSRDDVPRYEINGDAMDLFRAY